LIVPLILLAAGARSQDKGGNQNAYGQS